VAEIEALPVVMIISGGVLVYCSVKNKKPAEVVKLALQGKNPDGAAPISGGGAPGGPSINLDPLTQGDNLGSPGPVPWGLIGYQRAPDTPMTPINTNFGNWAV
jgi:hypothetical protein